MHRPHPRQFSWEAPDSRVRIIRHENLNEAPGNIPCRSLQDPEQWATAAAAKSLQSCPTLCDPIDGSPPGSAIPGILQARTPEWVATSFCPSNFHKCRNYLESAQKHIPRLGAGVPSSQVTLRLPAPKPHLK